MEFYTSIYQLPRALGLPTLILSAIPEMPYIDGTDANINLSCMFFHLKNAIVIKSTDKKT